MVPHKGVQIDIPRLMEYQIMPVDGKLLEILCCPVSKTPLARLPASKLDRLNQLIRESDVVTVTGERLTDPVKEALVTEDLKVIYPVVENIPILLEERGIGTTQFTDF